MSFATMRQLDEVTAGQARVVGREFAGWLNLTGGTRLVLFLLDLGQQIRHLEQENLDYLYTLPDDGLESDDVVDAMSNRLNTLRQKFNRLVSRYKVFPLLIDTEFSGSWTFRWELVDAPRRQLKHDKHARSRTTTDDLDALLAVVRLAQFGYLSRLNRCHCGKWYFERVSAQQFCSAKCRQWMFSKSETFKAQRREYMRRYYRLQRSRNVK
jgi:hypothetical protein